MIAVLDDLILSPLSSWLVDITSSNPDSINQALIWIMGSTIVSGAICIIKRFVYYD